MTVFEMISMIDALAPFDTQEEFDNSGLLVGDGNAEVTAALFALDVTPRVIDEAAALGAQLIVTHHPLMFAPRRTLTEGDYEGRLIRRLTVSGISLIAAHTNLDKSEAGTNAALVRLLDLRDPEGEGFIRVGNLPAPLTTAAFAERLSSLLGDSVRLMGPADAVIRRPGLCSGGGSDEWPRAAALGCDAFLSGEIKHHHALAMAAEGIAAFECGHSATEVPGIRALADALQKSLHEVECKVRIFKSDVETYAFPRQP